MAAKKLKEEVMNVVEEILDPEKAVKVTVNVEFQGIQHEITDVAKKAEQAYKESHPEAVIETLDVYCKPEEGVAYYVVNGEGSDDFKVEL